MDKLRSMRRMFFRNAAGGQHDRARGSHGLLEGEMACVLTTVRHREDAAAATAAAARAPGCRPGRMHATARLAHAQRVTALEAARAAAPGEIR